MKDIDIQFNIYGKLLDFITEINVYVTSEENVYGAPYKRWMDGRVFRTAMKAGRIVKIGLIPEQHHYLDDNSQCSHETYLHQFRPYLSTANYSHCPRKCSPVALPFRDLPICGWNQTVVKTFDCANEQFLKKLAEFSDAGNYLRPCDILQYTGELIWDIPNPQIGMFSNMSAKLEYEFLPPELTVVYQEYLIFDAIGMVGSVGGTWVCL